MPRQVAFPGPPHVPVIGWPLRAVRMLADPLPFFTTMLERHGEISTTSRRAPKHVFVFGPRYQRQLFGNPDAFIADAFREFRMPPRSAMARLTAGLLKLNGPAHTRHRSLMQPAFHSRAVARHHETIVKVTNEEFDRFRTGEVRRVDHDLSRLMLRIGMKTLFDVAETDDVDRLNGLIGRLLSSASAPLTLLMPVNAPGTSYRRTLRAADEVDAAVRRIIIAKRDAPGDDIISMLIAARDENGVGLTEDELVGEAYTAFCHDSSASALTWTLLMLDQHPQVRNDLCDELAAELGGAPPEPGVFGRLPLLDRVIKEALRLFPPASMGLRYAARDTELGPYRIPRNATIFFSPYVTHRLPSVFDEPLRYAPDRWTGPSPDSFGYLPFGAGPHGCLGRSFALLEMKIVLAIVLQRFRLAVVDGSTIDAKIKISLVPDQGLSCRVEQPGGDRSRAEVLGNIRTAVDLTGAL
ncbi:putative cytochrome P450 [Actinoplanes missouriensis 431]|uniref:Putative cytochrome P450 n=1 Tax=Actinoplanes missouriensis (strain ATCC 14538 / DSM 43046 / CBS 188.64 / JCM 3121 / NBRC 102363 / NCIMB 12654 / NRRL B-3342 / UNCC 431) TaxID=512565 RepID=I0H607_ACTM4|nr:cytochrome P450 [Actinoplanes missouriensis]BAL88444.1 putative cytochrome P450 [Actinoplanes missouriensis 431]